MTVAPENPARAHVLGLDLRSPVVVGSGLLTDQERNIRRLLGGGAGAVITKTIHPNPPRGGDERLLCVPTGMLNSTTYSRRPVDEWCDMISSFAEDGLPVIANLHADTPTELGDLAARVVAAGSPALELGISCLNEPLDDTPERVAAYTGAVRDRVDVPFSVKLALGEGAAARIDAALAAGADAITLSDTVAGLAVDPITGEVRLGGAYSGAGIKPLVLAEIYAMRERCITAPVLGSGGVAQASDVIEYLSVGANVAQVYSALHKDMNETLTSITNGVQAWLRAHHLTVSGVVGRTFQR